MAKDYNKIEVKDNMKINEESEEEVAQKEKKQLDKVVAAEPKKVKKSLIGRLVTGVVGPDGLPGIGSYVNEEIVKPAIKNIIVDAVTSGINMVMYGERGGAPRGGGYRPNITGGRGYTPRTNYGSNYRATHSHGPDVQPSERIARPAKQGVEEYIIEDRHDASQVLVTLTEQADMYDTVSVADYYDLIGVPSKYTDNNYGWTIDSMSRASIIPVRGGYIIKFPPVDII